MIDAVRQRELHISDIRTVEGTRPVMCAMSTSIQGEVDTRERSCYTCKACRAPRFRFHLCKEPGAGPWKRSQLEKELCACPRFCSTQWQPFYSDPSSEHGSFYPFFINTSFPFCAIGPLAASRWSVQVHVVCGMDQS